MPEFRFDPEGWRKAQKPLSQRAETAAHPPRRPSGPSDETWIGYVADLERLLGSLTWAGWELPESYDTDYDAEDGAYLFGELFRTGMVIEVQYEPGNGEVLLLPCEDEADRIVARIREAAGPSA
jgi:hypothetical protein